MVDDPTKTQMNFLYLEDRTKCEASSKIHVFSQWQNKQRALHDTLVVSNGVVEGVPQNQCRPNTLISSVQCHFGHLRRLHRIPEHTCKQYTHLFHQCAGRELWHKNGILRMKDVPEMFEYHQCQIFVAYESGEGRHLAR